MQLIEIKFFGVVYGFLFGIILTILSFAFRINLIYSQTLGEIPIYLGLIPIVLIILFTITSEKLRSKSLNLIYLFVTSFSFIYFYSKFQWTVDCCPDKYHSMYEWNAAKRLSWIVDLPLTFIIILIQGLIFDILKELNGKNLLKQEV